MLATSSSDDDDYDRKKPTPKAATSAAGKTATFLSPQKNGYIMGNGGIGVGSISSPNTPNMSGHHARQLNNAMAHMSLHNGDNASMKSSFSASSESVSLSNYQQPNNKNLHMLPNNQTANSSFKSNSSTNTLNTPKGHPRNNPNNNNRRQMPKRPGDSTNSFGNTAVNGYINNNSSGDEDLNSEYNYNNNSNVIVQNSDDDDEQIQNDDFSNEGI